MCICIFYILSMNLHGESIMLCAVFSFLVERPSLPELLRLKVPQQVGANYSTFGIYLLNDETGSRVDSIEEYCRGNPEKITRKILQEWLEGKGLPVTWQSLIQTLRDVELTVFADHIQGLKLSPPQ